MRLVECFPDQVLKKSKVLCASSYGHFIARKEFCYHSRAHAKNKSWKGLPRQCRRDYGMNEFSRAFDLELRARSSLRSLSALVPNRLSDERNMEWSIWGGHSTKSFARVARFARSRACSAHRFKKKTTIPPDMARYGQGQVLPNATGY